MQRKGFLIASIICYALTLIGSLVEIITFITSGPNIVGLIGIITAIICIVLAITFRIKYTKAEHKNIVELRRKIDNDDIDPLTLQ